ncbi:MAG: hypothetical protein M1813_006835 [Trichoglossum hirsutum]|nr:MAG: hypothetical protein M1813_006835 [Trichoglossum hirsutum]
MLNNGGHHSNGTLDTFCRGSYNPIVRTKLKPTTIAFLDLAQSSPDHREYGQQAGPFFQPAPYSALDLNYSSGTVRSTTPMLGQTNRATHSGTPSSEGYRYESRTFRENQWLGTGWGHLLPRPNADGADGDEASEASEASKSRDQFLSKRASLKLKIKEKFRRMRRHPEAPLGYPVGRREAEEAQQKYNLADRFLDMLPSNFELFIRARLRVPPKD